jgi:carbon storage regulator
MLVLSRKHGESIVIGRGITVTVLKMKGGVVQLGIDAPLDIPIRRSELPLAGRDLALPLVI